METGKTAEICIFLVEDHDIIRLMLREHLEIEPDLRIRGEAPTGRSPSTRWKRLRRTWLS